MGVEETVLVCAAQKLDCRACVFLYCTLKDESHGCSQQQVKHALLMPWTCRFLDP